eukprot:4885462-Amphidinium_carterae.3
MPLASWTGHEGQVPVNNHVTILSSQITMHVATDNDDEFHNELYVDNAEYIDNSAIDYVLTSLHNV